MVSIVLHYWTFCNKVMAYVDNQTGHWVVEFRQILLTACRILGTQNKAAAAISGRGGRKEILSPLLIPSGCG